MLILADWLITTPTETPKQEWGARVMGDVIADVAPNAELRARYPEDAVLDAAGQALAPGFVNAHTHTYGVLAHGIPLDKAPSGFCPFLAEFWWPLVEDRLDHAMIRAATDLQCAQMLRSGVTTFYDCLEAPFALPSGLHAQAEVVRQRGNRAILSFEATERVSPENGQLGLQENAEFIDAYQRGKRQEARIENPDRSPDACREVKSRKSQVASQDATCDFGLRTSDLISGMLCFHTTFTCSADFIRRAFALARERGALVHAHVAEGTYEPQYNLEQRGLRTLPYYDSLGVLGPDFLASQCVQIDQSEIDLLAARGARMVHMPLSNCEVGGGIAPVPELVAAGVTVGLGSDGYIDDFFEVMRGAFLLHKATHLDPQVMPASLVWYLATEGGARALGLDKVGRIAPGWQADLQLIDATLPTPLAAHNFYDQLLLYRNSGHVRAVWVAGNMLVRDGCVIDVDMDALIAHTHLAAHRLWKR